jgi:hypothetical protein
MGLERTINVRMISYAASNIKHAIGRQRIHFGDLIDEQKPRRA